LKKTSGRPKYIPLERIRKRHKETYSPTVLTSSSFRLGDLEKSKPGHSLSSSLRVPKPPASPSAAREVLSQFISAQSTAHTLTRGTRGTQKTKKRHGINNRERELQRDQTNREK